MQYGGTATTDILFNIGVCDFLTLSKVLKELYDGPEGSLFSSKFSSSIVISGQFNSDS